MAVESNGAPGGGGDLIVRAAIHPAIGVARVGDAETDYFIGPETNAPAPKDPGFYRDATGALKRQAARFRIYGFNAAGEVVRELTAADADITWTVHVANRKAAWYRFIAAMDIPDYADLEVPRRNAKIAGKDRETLVIDPGPRSITGAGVSGGADHAFDTGRFKGECLPLGELRTDDKGRLLFLGGHGRSGSPSGAPPFDPAEPDTFNNADDWYDDMSDGPVDATVTLDGRSVPVDGAWVVTTPPAYAPDLVSWRTMYDLMTDMAIANGWKPVPATTSFSRDVQPLLSRMSALQWVNKGFASLFGAGGPMDFDDPAFLAKLAQGPDAATGADPWGALRQRIYQAFRPAAQKQNVPVLWPWIYGDAFDSNLFGDSPRIMLRPPTIAELHLRRWVDGDFEADWSPDAPSPPADLDQIPLAEQPATLDRAAMDHCLADAFHPGCEMTWPMRHPTLYTAPYRIRRRPADQTEPDYGPTLDVPTVLGPTGPLHAQGPGDITRWMGLPWQGDTAYCRSGYDPSFDPYLPTFWPAHVPNQVLTEEDYCIVVDTDRPREERLAAFNRRASWFRFIDEAPDIPARMMRMVAHFGAQGLIEQRPGVDGDPDIPSVLFVETVPEAHKQALAGAALQAMTGPAEAAGAESTRDARLRAAGWGSAEHLAAARNLRARVKNE